MGTAVPVLRCVSRQWAGSYLGLLVPTWSLVEQESSARIVGQDMEPRRGALPIVLLLNSSSSGMFPEPPSGR